MKTNLSKFQPKMAALGFLLVSASAAFAQSTVDTTTTRTTSVGKVQEFSPDSITLTTSSSPTPVHYTYTKTTSYVDESGNPVAMETVKSGLPVTVYYDREGDQLVASKVVVRKSIDTNVDGAQNAEVSSATTTSTSTEGTVNTFSPDMISVRTENSQTPASYTFTKTTTYVDESGNPVSVDVVKSGAPVTIYYDYVNGQPVASKVIVRKSVTTDSDSMTDVKKTTTSTTTTTNP